MGLKTTTTRYLVKYSQSQHLKHNRSPDLPPMATFHPFPRLPTELRLRVWELTVEPRTVNFRIKQSAADDVVNNRFSIHYGSTRILPVHSSTPAPAALHACHEARNHLLHWKRVYQQVFCVIVNQNPARDSTYDEGYIYLHFELDTIDIGTTWFHDFLLFTYYHLPYSDSSQRLQQQQNQHSSFFSPPTPVPLASKILRLKFTRNFGDEYLDHWDIVDGLRYFVSLKEVFCVCGDGIMAWGSATEWIGFGDLSCGEEGVWLIDGKNGGGLGDGEDKARKAVEWDEIWGAFKMERERERGYGGGGGGGGGGGPGGGYQYPPPLPPPSPPSLPSPPTF
ncbi:hypothetical protein SMACR_04062 [Sordaria macrospora]|uniref:WGS project CABT00000000 data, contig 2.17 n=2 Tax=Sordaria macrospora TaxID=5147 RepID=F7W0Q7_SORMK|nr:uncharacterized protein SMAC_04062 [Sordaria macrospora k-hell]KAA8633565.1 hypothetical protein SMACR_04062 [Sordaria macrospora]WPJ60193.1 hypothetical protein SMAC4_04062 [Sordaria macrospora]CCC11359.1 unnamed protein product [Sordaria macrospora k-hell]